MHEICKIQVFFLERIFELKKFKITLWSYLLGICTQKKSEQNLRLKDTWHQVIRCGMRQMKLLHVAIKFAYVVCLNIKNKAVVTVIILQF